MKKLLSVLLALAMLFGLAACGETKTENTPAYSQGLNNEGYYDIKASDYVTLPEYDGMEIPADVRAVDESDIDSQIEALLSNHSETNEITDRAIVDGDKVNIDYTGYLDGVAFDNGAATGQTVTAGSPEFIDDFLTQIIGHKPGEEFDVEVTFPDPYPNGPDMAGKDVVFDVKINYIAETVLPELNDDFVKENFKDGYGLKTVPELRAYISEILYEQQLRTYIDDYLFAGAVVKEIPDVVIEHQKNCVKANYDDMALSYGIDVNTLISYYGYSSMDDLLANSTAELEEMAKDMLIYQAVAEDLGVKISNKDIADYFDKQAGTRDYTASESHYGIGYIKMMVLNNTVIEYIMDHSK